MTSAWLADCLIGKAVDDEGEEKGDAPLSVTGYQCKLFDDAERAEEVNSGASLIPCINDSTLRVDRFDCRSHLWSLHKFDAEQSQGESACDEIDATEAEMERECDEERYRDLTEASLDEADSAEERGRAGAGAQYAAVPFSYQGASASQKNWTRDETETETETETDIETEEPFSIELLDGVKLPDDIELPATVKEHVLIRKTAEFVARHGPQMEILIKMKRTSTGSGSPQTASDKLAFLDFEHVLNPYYKTLVKLLRDGVLQPQPEPTVQPQPDLRATDNEDHGHKQTDGDVRPEAQLDATWLARLPKVSTHGTAFAKLVEQFRGDSQPRQPAPMPFDARYAYLYAQYYSYFTALQGAALGAPPAPPPVAQSVPDPTSEPEPAPVEAPVDSNQFSDAVQTPCEPTPSESTPVNAAEDSTTNAPTPTIDLRTLIDKTAEYVARNGDEFERLLAEREAAKGDARFAFLQPTNWLHAFFRERVHAFKLTCALRVNFELKRPGPAPPSTDERKPAPPKRTQPTENQRPPANTLANMFQQYASDQEDESDASDQSDPPDKTQKVLTTNGDDGQLATFLEELESVPTGVDAKREERKKRAAHFFASIGSNKTAEVHEHDQTELAQEVLSLGERACRSARSSLSRHTSPAPSQPRSQSRPSSLSKQLDTKRSRSKSRSKSRSRSNHSQSKSQSKKPRSKRSRSRSKSRSRSRSKQTRSKRSRSRSRSKQTRSKRSRSRSRSKQTRSKRSRSRSRSKQTRSKRSRSRSRSKQTRSKRSRSKQKRLKRSRSQSSKSKSQSRSRSPSPKAKRKRERKRRSSSSRSPSRSRTRSRSRSRSRKRHAKRSGHHRRHREREHEHEHDERRHRESRRDRRSKKSKRERSSSTASR